MKMYYISGLPYSENELYHHGVPNQKWGIRNYQYSDGSLTPLGREHYGVGPVKGARDNFASRYAKRAGQALKRHIKTKHPWMMSEDEIEEYTRRAQLERTYLTVVKENAEARKKAEGFVEKLAQREVERFSDKSIDALSRKLYGDLLDKGGGKDKKKDDKDDKDDDDDKDESSSGGSGEKQKKKKKKRNPSTSPRDADDFINKQQMDFPINAL